MVGRRRNLFILLFVVGLTIASVLVIISQPTKLGLDQAAPAGLPGRADTAVRGQLDRAIDRDHP